MHITNLKTETPLSFMQGAINRSLIASGITPAKESLYTQIHQSFSLEESLRIAYIPIILNKTAFYYAEQVCIQCAREKLSQKLKTRLIKNAISSYIDSTLGKSVSQITLKMLEEKTMRIFNEASGDMQTLWFVVNGELKKVYPELEDYGLLTNIYCAVSILYFVQRYEGTIEMEIQRRTGIKNASCKTVEPITVYDQLLAIAGQYTFEKNDMLNLALKIIALKVERVVLELFEIHKMNVKGDLK